MRQRGSMIAGFVVLLMMAVSVPVCAADYPSRAITLIIPYSAGGSTDTVGRMFVQVFSKHLKQSVVVENKPGAGAVLGTKEMIKANPDGYTLGLFSNALVASHYVLPDTILLWKEVEPVALFNDDPISMAVATKSRVGSLNELIDLGKKSPKQLTLGTNPGTVNSLFAVRLLKMAGVEVTEVPFKGGGEAKVALAGGHIDIHFDTVRVYQPLVEAQKVKILGISSGSRIPYFSDIPTFKEQGLDLTWGSWNGIFAPKKTPPEIITTLAKAIDTTVRDKEFLEMMKKNISVVRYLERQEFTRALEAEERVIREVTTEMGLYKPKQ